MVKVKDFIENDDLFYPSSDGKRMAENTLQFEWLVKIKLNLERMTGDKKIFVAGDLLWYPVEGNKNINKAPDVMVAIGRPKGNRSSYRQWRENNIAPQVVFEILSPANKPKEMKTKLAFYETYGVQEYYIYHPHKNTLEIRIREENHLPLIENKKHWTSPLLNIHFHQTSQTLGLFYPDKTPFLSFVELSKLHADAIHKLSQAQQVILEKDKRLREKDRRLQQKDKRLQQLEEKLKDLGINPADL